MKDGVAAKNKTFINREIRGSYIFEMDKLVSVSRIISEMTGNKSDTNVSLSNDRSMSSDDIISVLSDLYIDVVRIKSLSIKSRSEDYTRSIEIRIGGSWLSAIEYTISGDRTFAVASEEQLTSLITPCKAWYGLVNVNNYSIPVQLIILLLLGFVFGLGSASLVMPKSELLAGPVFFSMIGVSIATLPWLLEAVAPKVVFNFGRGAVVRKRITRPLAWFYTAVLLSSLAAAFKDVIRQPLGW